MARVIETDAQNAVNSIKSLLSATSKSGHPVYLLIDEYDNFANIYLDPAFNDLCGFHEAEIEKAIKTIAT